MFKHHRYPKVVILQAVYFKLRFTLSYRDIEELLQIRGVEVDHSTIQRWVFKFTPEIEKNMHKRNIKRRIQITTGFKEFESAKRTLSGIESVHIIRKNQIIDSKQTYYRTFLSLVA